MKTTELIAKIAQENEITKKAAKECLEMVVASIVGGMTTEGSVRISGLGTFSVKETSVRMGRNPKTGEEIEIPASKAPKFKASSTLKKFVKGE